MSTPSPPSEVSWSSSRFAGNALRMRFFPSRRVRMFFLAGFPWIDALLLTAFVLSAAHENAYLPGEKVDLPTAPFEDGDKPRIVLVVTCENPGKNTLAFFDGIRYSLADPGQREKLSVALGKVLPYPVDSAEAALFVDKAVSFEGLSDLLTLLRETGLSRVFFATRTP